MNFASWLTSKKIDAEAFRKAENQLFVRLEMEFEQMHPNSFAAQKLNLINPIRRKYQLAPLESPTAQVTEAAPPKAAAKPVMRPKPKIN